MSILHDHDIAMAILSSILQADLLPCADGEKNLSFRIDPDHFTHPLHRSVAKAISKLQERGTPPLDGLVQETLKISTRDETTQNAYIEILAANPLSPQQLDAYYKILKSRRAARLLKALK